MTQQSHLHTVESDARFEAGDETTDNGRTPPTPPGGNASRTAQKSRSERPLPTDRLKFENQVAVLKAVAQASGNNRRGMDAKAMSAALNLGGETGGLNSRFFRSIGWFEIVGRGEYTASPGLLAWNQYMVIDDSDHQAAAAPLREEFMESWVWKAVGSLFSEQPISIKVILLELAKAAGAHNHTYQLETIVDWMTWVRLIDREGDQLKLNGTPVRETPSADETTDDSTDDTGETVAARGTKHEVVVDDVVGLADEAIPTSATVDGAIVSFNLSVRLTADELKDLDQEQRDFLLAFAERLRG